MDEGGQRCACVDEAPQNSSAEGRAGAPFQVQKASRPLSAAYAVLDVLRGEKGKQGVFLGAAANRIRADYRELGYLSFSPPQKRKVPSVPLIAQTAQTQEIHHRGTRTHPNHLDVT